MSDDSIVEYRNLQDKRILKKVGYPVIALTPEEEELQREIIKKNTPSSLGDFLDRTFPPGFLGAFLLIVLIWSTMFPLLIVIDTVFLQSIPTMATMLTYTIPSLFSVIAFFYAVVLRFRPLSHQVYEAIMGLYYYPLPQSHTRGRKIIVEAYNISKDILDSYAWKEGIADRTRDIRTEIVDIINETMRIYNKGIREVEGYDEELRAIQEKLDNIRHYARHEMTARTFGIEQIPENSNIETAA